MAKVKRWGKKRKYERDWKAYNERLIKRGEYYINPAFLALQGIMRGLSRHFNNFPVISFSQIRRRMLELPLNFDAKAKDLIVGIDGSGLKVSNRGEWMRQAWV